MSFLCVYLDLMWRRVIGTVFFVLGQPFRSLSLDLKADGCHWHPKSHVSLGLPLGCIKNFKIGTALGTVSHELVNHISTSSWILGRFTAKAHLGQGAIMIHSSCVIMIHLKSMYRPPRSIPELSPNLLQTIPEPAQRISTIPLLSPCTQAPTNHFLSHCSFLQNLPAPPKFPQRDWREHKKPLPGSPICASNKLKSVHECVMM